MHLFQAMPAGHGMTDVIEATGNCNAPNCMLCQYPLDHLATCPYQKTSCHNTLYLILCVLPVQYAQCRRFLQHLCHKCNRHIKEHGEAKSVQRCVNGNLASYERKRFHSRQRLGCREPGHIASLGQPMSMQWTLAANDVSEMNAVWH